MNRFAVSILLAFCIVSSLASTGQAKADTHWAVRNYTVKQLQSPCKIENDVIVQLGGWAVDDMASQYVPDIAELMGAGEPPVRHPEKKTRQLRLRVYAMANRDILFSKAAVSVYDRHGRKVDLLPDDSQTANVPLGVPGKGRDYIGMYLFSLTPARRKSSGADHGGWVSAVSPLSPAHKAGIHKGDVVTQVGSREIRTQDDADSFLGPNRTMIGPLQMTVIRSGRRLHFLVKPVPDPLQKSINRVPAWSRMKSALPQVRGKVPLYICRDMVSIDPVPTGFQPARIGFALGR